MARGLILFLDIDIDKDFGIDIRNILTFDINIYNNNDLNIHI